MRKILATGHPADNLQLTVALYILKIHPDGERMLVVDYYYARLPRYVRIPDEIRDRLFREDADLSAPAISVQRPMLAYAVLDYNQIYELRALTNWSIT